LIPVAVVLEFTHAGATWAFLASALGVHIAVGSAAQIALFVAPVLVLSSFLIGPFPMALVFNGFEIGAIFLAVLIAQEITQRGDTTWFEGLQLLAVYAVLALTFFFV
jgi:Ca2+:H+ antiporter